MRETPSTPRLLFGLIVACAFAAIIWLVASGSHQPSPRMLPPVTVQVAPPPVAAVPTPVSLPPAAYESAIGPPVAPPLHIEPHASGTGEVALVIDDCGISNAQMAPTAFLPAEVTFSFLPYGRATRSVADAANRAGRDVILHMPMQPLGPSNPGPDALTVGLDPVTAQARVTAGLEAVPHAIGMNNHEGSAATADPALMQAIMPLLRDRQLFFLDSYTSAKSIAYKVAQAEGVTTLRRDIFLDDTVAPEAIAEQLRRLVIRAKKQGSAIAIGHPHPETLAALRDWLPTLDAQGIRLVRLKDLMQRNERHD